MKGAGGLRRFKVGYLCREMRLGLMDVIAYQNCHLIVN